jgi:hypothetical protein
MEDVKMMSVRRKKFLQGRENGGEVLGGLRG